MTTEATAEPAVSVVVPCYDRPDQLDRLLSALELQTIGRHRFEVVVADDGSAQRPDPGRRSYPVRVVRQSDQGFRAAAARNLGARAAHAPVVAFLDQDCVPSPRYLEKVVGVMSGGWSLTVGRRRHVDLDGWDAARTSAWLTGGSASPRDLDDPRWLVDGYTRTDNLRRPDPRSYQLVISAVLSVSRDLHRHLSGFDEGFTAYGGEDWDYGHRAIVAGAELRHLPDAVVWHDGPDLAGRDRLVGTKNTETLALARRVPDRDLRGEHLVWNQPDIVVRLDAQQAEPATIIASVDSLLAGSDAHVWVTGLTEWDDDAVDDPRFHRGVPPSTVLDRARYVVDCGAVLLAGRTLRHLCRQAPLETEHFTLQTTRDVNRSRRHLPTGPQQPWPTGARVTLLREAPLLERHWQTRA